MGTILAAMRSDVMVPPGAQIWRRLGWVMVYAVAMGLLEAICVIYLRHLLAPADAEHPGTIPNRLKIEVVREACTLAMILSVAWIAGFNARSRAAYFFFIFGVWDVLYYVGLKWLADWPAGWLQWDCLFLIPKPWYGPVLAPVLISGYFAAGCVLILSGEARGQPVRVSWATVGLQLLAGAVWYWSFIKDADRISAQGYGAIRYSWLLFGLALAIGLMGFRLSAGCGSVRGVSPAGAGL